MAAAVGKYAANKMLRKEMKKYANKNVSGEQDPYFAYIEDPRRPGKTKKVKKLAPAYIPEHDAAILNAFRRRAYRLDMGLFNLFGIRFGWEAVIGLIPFLGDVIGVLLALSLVRSAMKIDGGLDTTVQTRMYLNVALDFAVGLVPFVGDLADAAFKCNTRNVRLLERVLDKKYKPKGGEDEAFHRNSTIEDRRRRAQNRKSGIYHPQDLPPATAWEDFEDEGEQLPTDARVPAANGPQRGEPVPARDNGRRWSSWFSSSRPERRPDVEMARDTTGQQSGTIRA